MTPLLFTIALAAAGVAAAAFGLLWSRRPALGAGQYLRDLEGLTETVDQYDRELAEPFFVRVVRPFVGSLSGSVSRLTPRNYLETTHAKLLLGGRSSRIRAEEFVVAQAVGTGLLTVLALLYA
ncbi:MAG: hypothetical protein ACRD1K_05450, partial [Acidimicrobiales bacterium]